MYDELFECKLFRFCFSKFSSILEISCVATSVLPLNFMRMEVAVCFLPFIICQVGDSGQNKSKKNPKEGNVITIDAVFFQVENLPIRYAKENPKVKNKDMNDPVNFRIRG